MQLKIGDWLPKYLDKTLGENETTTMAYPPPIAKPPAIEEEGLQPGSPPMSWL
jgi:hypothetical protein